jgi:FKBP-type peptidyl-prolyl cis-trans isomerase FkpA
MKNFFVITLVSVITLMACKKDKDCKSLPPSTIASAAEVANLQAYLALKGITNAINLNGMYYVLNNAGSGTSPNLCSNIAITYRGSFIFRTGDGAGFDSTINSPRSFTLNSLIPGWQLALPLVKTNGSVTLFIPPSLGYGSNPRNGIPGNSYLKFTLNLLSVD